MAKCTTPEFIEKAIKIHGAKYDYALVNYTGVKNKIEIICPEHGSFWQRPDIHLARKGCPDCGGSNKHTNESFVKSANKVHNSIYTYENTNYVNKIVLR